MSISEERWHTQAAGQVVIVTGGGGVIGSAIGAAFGRAGARVAIADVSPDLLAGAVVDIEQAGGRALGFQVDVTDRAAVEQLVTQVEHELGPVDLLINNAARLGAIGPFWEVDPDDWWRTLEVNLRGTMLCSRAVLPGMVERRRGRIINLSSGSVLGPVQYFSAYPVSKTAITRLTEHLAADTREYGISIFAITPGLVYSPSARETFESPSGRKWIGQYEEVYAARHVPPELAAERCLALASGMADGLSGCYIQLADDLDDLVLRAEEVQTTGLYTLRIRGENATPTTPRVARHSG